MEKINFEEDRYCPVFERTIDCEHCYESLMGISGLTKISSVPELNELSDIKVKEALSMCKKCKYSEL